MIDPRAARGVADLPEGHAFATVELDAPPERVFDALVSNDVTRWWVRPGVFDTREWKSDVRPGGRWEATGLARGEPYTLEGEYLEVDRPLKLVHTWHLRGQPGTSSTLTYVLEPAQPGTRLTLRQSKFENRANCLATAIGWETSFEELSRMLSAGL